MIIDLALPAPPAELSPNKHLDWWVKNPIKRAYQDACYEVVHQAKVQAWNTGLKFPLAEPVLMAVTFVFPNNIRRDIDNCISSCKALFDSLVKAGLLNDDSVQAIGKVEYGWEFEKGKSEVRVKLWDANEWNHS